MPKLWEIYGGGSQESMEAPQEEMTQELPYLGLDVDDEELISRINASIDLGSSLYEKVKDRAQINRAYWKGNQLDPTQLKDYQAKVVSNIIFRNMETMLPIITKNTPLVNFVSSNKDMDRLMQELTFHRWEVEDNMLAKNRLAVRAAFLDLLGVLKYRYDPQVDDICWEFVKTRNIIVDPYATRPEDVEFVAEYIGGQTVKEIIRKFPDAKDKLLKELGIKDETSKKMGYKPTYIEFWTPEMVVWKYKDVILDKYKNPNWDWGKSKNMDEFGKQTTKTYNLWKKPRVPYIFLSIFNLGEHLYSTTSLIEQSLSQQDNINKRKRQIADNADEANGILVGSGEFISREEFAKIDQEPNLKVWGEGGNPAQGLVRIPGNPLQEYVYTDMLQSEKMVDDIWGIHAITRGVSEADTATQDVLQQKQDYGRIDDIVKAYEDFNEQYYQATFQMMLVHYEDEHYFSFEEEDDLALERKDLIAAYKKIKKRKINRETGRIETLEEEGEFTPPVIMVKRGTTLPTDEVTRRKEALQLASASAISILDLYEKLNWPNPRESAKRLLLQEAGQIDRIFPELRQEMQEEPSEAAEEDFRRIMQGKPTPPDPEVENPETAAKHIKTHEGQLDSQEFQRAEDEAKQELIEHIRQEVEIAKQTLAQVEGGQPPAGGQGQPPMQGQPPQGQPPTPQGRVPMQGGQGAL